MRPLLPAVVLSALLGQSRGGPTFRSVSIKPNTNSARRAIIVRVEQGGRLDTSDSPLVVLVKNAYGVQDFHAGGEIQADVPPGDSGITGLFPLCCKGRPEAPGIER